MTEMGETFMSVVMEKVSDVTAKDAARVTAENFGTATVRTLPLVMIAGVPARKVHGTTIRLTGSVSARREDGDGREHVTAVTVERLRTLTISTLWGASGVIDVRIQQKPYEAVRLAWVRVLVKNGVFAGMSARAVR